MMGIELKECKQTMEKEEEGERNDDNQHETIDIDEQNSSETDSFLVNSDSNNNSNDEGMRDKYNESASSEPSTITWVQQQLASPAVLSSMLYTFCSVGMVLANKFIPFSLPLEVRDEIPSVLVVWFQCLVALVLVSIAKYYKLVEYPDFDWEIVKAWLPLNIFFIAMLVTGFMSLFYCSVPIVTVFKNLTNIITIYGDKYFFDQK